MTRSLIVGVDDTDDSRNALARAAEWARVAGLRLVVVHVRHMPPSALTSDNSAIVIIDYAAGFGNVSRCRSKAGVVRPVKPS